MNTRVVVFAVAFLAGGPVIASDKSDVVAVAHKWVDSFNKGDFKSGLATCTDESTIIDDIPPYEWHGTGACNAWFNDSNAWDKQHDEIYDHVSIDKVRHIQIAGDRAYVVLSATVASKVKGKTALDSEKGFWTLAMKKDDHGWRITGWSWTMP